jgi:tRNA pseudouridine65 synthase
LELEILYKDEYLVAINKPHGLLVHRWEQAADVTIFAVQELRNQIGQHVFPAHRLDRKTGGVLLFSLSEDINSIVSQNFMNKEVGKTYLAIVRGFTNEVETINYSLKNDKGKLKEAVTHFNTLQKVEINVSSNEKHTTSRYSLLELKPETGRKHQLRKHLAHIMHPIVGDRPHGCNKQNKFFLKHFNLEEMMLHAYSLEIIHPVTQKRLIIKADLQPEFKRIINELGFNLPYSQSSANG